MFGKRFRYNFLLIFLLPAAVVFRSSPQWVEHYYAQGMYPVVSRVLRILFGWLPFSVGDIFYAVLLILSVVTLVRFLRKFKRPLRVSEFLGFKNTARFAGLLCWCWLLFQLLWGFNYARVGVIEQFGLSKIRPDSNMVRSFASYSLREVNRFAPARKNQDNQVSIEQLTRSAYLQLSKEMPGFSYDPVSFKTSSFGLLGNYMGYGGYYNPFSGEAHLNDRLPSFLLPFIGVHEVAHQLGFAKESDANFIGYLAAIHAEDSSLRYAAHLEFFLYANAALRRFDSTAAKVNYGQLSPLVKKDLDHYRRFTKQYKGWVDDLTTWFYSRFLRLNRQPEGMGSYNKGMTYAMMYWHKKNRQ